MIKVSAKCRDNFLVVYCNTSTEKPLSPWEYEALEKLNIIYFFEKNCIIYNNNNIQTDFNKGFNSIHSSEFCGKTKIILSC